MSVGAPTMTACFPVGAAKLRAYVVLVKPRITAMVLVTTLVGFYLGSPGLLDHRLLIHVLLATALVAGGSGALNMVMERGHDARMERTARRPLPAGLLSVTEASRFGILLSALGIGYTLLRVNPLTAFLSGATLLSYLFLYTPLKRRSSLCTVVGAVSGALPPVIGWTAVRNSAGVEAWSLFVVLFVWQIPHFLAIAWMYRDDYARAGFPMLPVVEPDGGSTSRQTLLYSLALLPASLLPAVTGLVGSRYFCGALLVGLGFIALSIIFAAMKTEGAGKRLFLASIIYLPVLLALMMFDKVF